MNCTYNDYHKNRKAQKRIISESSFTYGKLISLIDPYVKKGLQVLDLGCGVGTLDFYLSNKGCCVTGVGISSKAISNARSNAKIFKLKNTSFIICDVTKFKNKKPYDLIICNEIIEHIKNDKKFMQNVKCNIKRSGIVFLSTPLESAPLYSVGLLKDFDQKVGHIRRYNYLKLKNVVEENGFQIIQTYITEGIFRNLLFTHDFFIPILRLANRFVLVSTLFNSIDKILLKIFGPSNISLLLISSK